MLDERAQQLNHILENDNGQTGLWNVGPIGSALYAVDGGSIDTQYGIYDAYSYVIEVNTSDFQPDYDTWRDITVKRQRTAWQYFLRQTLDGSQINGRVTDAATGQPLAATVSVAEVTYTHGEAPRTADARGLYHWLTQSAHTYHVTYSMAGYCTETRTVAVGDGPVTVDVMLGHPAAPAGASATGNGDNRIDVEATVKAIHKTGVEMEALTAAAVAGLTIYDMCKAADRAMTVGAVRLLKKTGGKSGTYERKE